jgi:hypothetical protein
MNYDFQQTRFSKSLLSGLATATIVIIACLIYAFIYRHVTNFTLSMIVNVTSIIFTSFIVCVIAGIAFYVIVPYLHQKTLLYTGLFIALTVIFIVIGLVGHRSANPAIAEQFRGLYIGVVSIIGLCCAFLLPYFTSHKNAFFD